MTGELWRWDLETFRALHALSGNGLVSTVARTLSDSGLGHVQLLAVPILAAWRRWPRWVGASLVLAWASACWAYERDGSALAACALCLALFARSESRALWWGALCGVAAGALRIAVEPLFDRVRPSNLPFADPLEPVFGASSFPSGHATTTGALVAGVLLAGRQGRGGWLLATWGVAVAASRVVIGVHFVSDVLGGLGFGVAVAALASAVLQGRAETAATS
jgi:membrane-associated phospholipid phosphatase